MAFILHDRTGVIYHTSSLLDRPGLIHGFSTRLGGVSEGMFASMNLRFGGPERDDRDRVTENYHRFTAALGADPGGVVLSCPERGYPSQERMRRGSDERNCKRDSWSIRSRR